MRVEGKALPTALVKADGGDREVFALIMGTSPGTIPRTGLGAKKPKKADPSYPVAGEPQTTKKQAGACFFKIMRRE